MRTLSKLIKNIPVEYLKRGENWYPEANDYANELSTTYNISFDRVCAVLSALSPANYWENNKVEAKILIEYYVAQEDYTAYSFRTYGANVAKAWEILTNLDKPVSNFFNMKTGFKTLAFYMNILNPNCKNYVTIDRHMIAIINGRIGKPSGSARITTKQYREMQAEFITASKKSKLTPSSLQAALWEWHIDLIKTA